MTKIDKNPLFEVVSEEQSASINGGGDLSLLAILPGYETLVLLSATTAAPLDPKAVIDDATKLLHDEVIGS